MMKAARTLWRLVVPVVLGAGGTAAAEAQEPPPEKSEFNLFNPTPPEYMREMDTDFPGATESPYTVDAGHLQLETLASWAHDRDSFDGVDYRFDAWSIGPLTLKVGVLNRLDAQLVLEPYQLVSEREEASRLTQRGFGDTTLRFKFNVWGNDGGSTALAVTPYVKFPTSQDGLGSRAVEGGVAVPMALALPGDFYLGLTTRFDAVRDYDDRGYHPEFSNSIAFGHDLFGPVFGYVEFFGSVSTEPDADWVGTVDAGLIWGLTENVQVNAGLSIGVTRWADDLNPFIGVAWRY